MEKSKNGFEFNTQVESWLLDTINTSLEKINSFNNLNSNFELIKNDIINLKNPFKFFSEEFIKYQILIDSKFLNNKQITISPFSYVGDICELDFNNKIYIGNSQLLNYIFADNATRLFHLFLSLNFETIYIADALELEISSSKYCKSDRIFSIFNEYISFNDNILPQFLLSFQGFVISY